MTGPIARTAARITAQRAAEAQFELSDGAAFARVAGWIHVVRNRNGLLSAAALCGCTVHPFMVRLEERSQPRRCVCPRCLARAVQLELAGTDDPAEACDDE